MTGGAIQDNYFYNLRSDPASGGAAIFGNYRNLGILGNNLGPSIDDGSFGIRAQPLVKSTVSNNTIINAYNKPLLSVRALGHVGGSDDPTTDSYYFYISDNKLDAGTLHGGNAQMFQIAPSAINQNNWLYDGIVERNWMVLHATQDAFFTFARRITVRNNICDGSASSPNKSIRCFKVYYWDATRGVPNADAIRFFNNTCYSAGPSIGFYCLALDADTGGSINNTTIENNLAYAPYRPSGTAPALIETTGGGTINNTVGSQGTRGNSSTSQIRNTSPSFDAIGSRPFGFRVSTGSYAIDLNTPITHYPELDFALCANNAGHIASGAFNPRAQAQCIGAGN